MTFNGFWRGTAMSFRKMCSYAIQLIYTLFSRKECQSCNVVLPQFFELPRKPVKKFGEPELENQSFPRKRVREGENIECVFCIIILL